jgi:hypothetical protein
MPRLDAEVIEKIELPLNSDNEIADVVSRFENCSLPYCNWTHRAHLCVAASYVRHLSFHDAMEKLRHHINQYNHACGDEHGYNETITILFLKQMCHDMDAGHCCNSLAEELLRLESEYGISWLYRYYSKELIWSDQAKTGWIEPDLNPLEF